MSSVLGIAEAFLATFIGQAVGWYRADQGAGFIGAIVGAVVRPVHLESACCRTHHWRSRHPVARATATTFTPGRPRCSRKRVARHWPVT
jgi:hypothetical protein